MKSIIIYKGRYGATKQYAAWLSQELKIPCESAEHVPGNIADYDCLVIGSSVYIGKLEIRNWLKKNLGNLGNRKIFFFLVSGTPAQETAKLEAYLRTGFSPELREKIEVFPLPGRLKVEQLSWIDRLLLRIGARLAGDLNTRERMLANYDHVKKENLSELVKRIKAFSGKPAFETTGESQFRPAKNR